MFLILNKIKDKELNKQLINDFNEITNFNNDFIINENTRKIINIIESIDLDNYNDKILEKDKRKETMILYNNYCFKHGEINSENDNLITKIQKRKFTVENPDRLSVLLQPPFGILLSDFFTNNCKYKADTKQAAIADITKVHDYNYLISVKAICDEMKMNNNNNIRKYGKFLFIIKI